MERREAATLPRHNGSTIRPLPSISRQREVVSRIKQYIEGNGLQPGDRLPGEEWFASAMGVGRPLVREALKGLEAVGAVETRKGIGRFVGTFDPNVYMQHFAAEVLVQSFDERELMEARCLLEIASVADAVERLTDDDLQEVTELLQTMRQRIERGDSYIAEDIGMHRVIMRHTENRFIGVMLDTIYAIGLARGDGHLSREGAAEDLAEHEAIAGALLARDRDAIRASLMDHFDTTAARLGFTPHWRDLFQPVPALFSTTRLPGS